MKLIRYYWERPSEFCESGFRKGIFSEECNGDDVKTCIENRKKVIIDENYNRIITKIKVYTLDEELEGS